MSTERRVGRLKAGDAFRDWLADILGDRLPDPDGDARVYRIEPASHVVCRYEFAGGVSVIGKFFGEPTGANSHYDPRKAMKNEYHRIRHVSSLVRVPPALAVKSRFHAALVTDYVPGPTIQELIVTKALRYDHLTGVAHLLRQLHDNTRTSCNRVREFSYFHKVLDQNRLSKHQRERFNRFLGTWWHSPRIRRDEGCMVHGDATPANYLVNDSIWAIDFEGSRNHAHPIRDLGILAAEIKASPANARAEGYIGHLLWHYSNSEEEFLHYSGDLPFFMALGYLRIARLPWWAGERCRLLREAEACLAAGPV